MLTIQEEEKKRPTSSTAFNILVYHNETAFIKKNRIDRKL